MKSYAYTHAHCWAATREAALKGLARELADHYHDWELDGDVGLLPDQGGFAALVSLKRQHPAHELTVTIEKEGVFSVRRRKTLDSEQAINELIHWAAEEIRARSRTDGRRGNGE